MVLKSRGELAVFEIGVLLLRDYNGMHVID